MIGLLLAAVGIFLGRESGGLLVGERTDRARIQRVKEIISADPSVDRVGDPAHHAAWTKSGAAYGEHSVPARLGSQAVGNGDRIENRVRENEPMIERIFIKAESFKRTNPPLPQAA